MSPSPSAWNATPSAGYSRVVLAGASLYYMSYHPNLCTLLYSISCLLDAFDGWAARKYNQSTKFGAVLDTLFPLEPLPLKMERVRTRIWSKVKSGT